jgi:DNA end-binding protein Ku
MRSIWTGAISFGLINIPVKLFSAVEDSSIDFDMLDKRDHSNIHFKRVNADTGKEVPFSNIVKGYKLGSRYVVLDDKDFESADVVKTKTIGIISFVDEQEIDPIYYEQPYYLEPDKTGVKAYALLRDSLASAGKVGVASFVLRNREALATLTPRSKGIVLNKIRFEEEIRDMAELNLPPASKGNKKEMQMAEKLIDQLTEKFDISKYKDTYSSKLMHIIKQKAKGKKVTPPKLKVVHHKDTDLMGMLKASLEEKRKKAS